MKEKTVKCEKSSNKCPDTCKHKEWHIVFGYSLSCELKHAPCESGFLCPNCREEGEAKTPFYIEEIIKSGIIDEEGINKELKKHIKEREKYITKN